MNIVTYNITRKIQIDFRRIRIGASFQGAKWYGGIVDIKGENLIPGDGPGIQKANLWLKSQGKIW